MRHLQITDYSDLHNEPDIPDDFQYAAYKKEILIFFQEVHEKQPSIYPSMECADLTEDVESITGRLLTTRSDKKKVFNRSRVLTLLEKNNFKEFRHQLMEFICSAEAKVSWCTLFVNLYWIFSQFECFMIESVFAEEHCQWKHFTLQNIFSQFWPFFSTPHADSVHSDLVFELRPAKCGQ